MNALSNVIFAGRFINDNAALVDIVDSLSLMTTNMLIAMALVQSYKQFSGRAIECLTPDVMPFAGSEEVIIKFINPSSDSQVVMSQRENLKNYFFAVRPRITVPFSRL